jgi:hypothetical protein
MTVGAALRATLAPRLGGTLRRDRIGQVYNVAQHRRICSHFGRPRLGRRQETLICLLLMVAYGRYRTPPIGPVDGDQPSCP